jgi:DNA-binding phage protein
MQLKIVGKTLNNAKKSKREVRMPLTRNFKDTVMARAKTDKEFREELIVEATNVLLEGVIETGKSLIRDYLNATEAFTVVAEQLQKDEKSLRRMLGPSGNPTLKNFIGILRACSSSEHLSLKVCHH